MIKLDDNLLQELGLGALPPEEKKKMLAHIYETLEMRVGMSLAKQMNDGQLQEFEQFINRNDEAGALQWLETNFPNYRDVVAAEFEKLKAEVRQSAPQIMAAASQQQAMPPVQPQQYQQGQQPYGPAPQQQPMQDPYYQQQQPGQQPMGPAPQPYVPQPMQQPMPQQQPAYQQPAPVAPQQQQPYYPPQPQPGQPGPGAQPMGGQGQQPGQPQYPPAQSQSDYDLAA